MATQEKAAGPRLGGRKAEASVNDRRVLAAAQDVLTVAPDTPMGEIAARAGVGIGSLYRRFPSKDALVRRLLLDGMDAIMQATREALDRVDADPWDAFGGFLQAATQARAGSLRGLAASRPADDALNVAAGEMGSLIEQLLTRAQAAGAVRDDVTANDVGLLFEMLSAVRVGDNARSDALRRRYLQMLLPAFRSPAASQLSEPSASWQEISAAWNP